MNETEQNVRAVTKLDIKALKAADDVCFFYDRDNTHDTGGQFFIKAIKRGRRFDEEVFATEDAHRIIPVDGGTRRIYDKENGGDEKVTTCYASISAFDATWRTVMNVVREGDRLSLHFIAGNDNETLKNAGLHHDEFRLRIERDDRRAKEAREFEFWLDDFIGPNNSARMVQRS